MKVIMLGRIGLLEVGGGDKVQIVNTATKLRGMGVQVDISDSLNIDLSPYDIVHIFQLDWGSEAYFYAKKAKKAGKKIVLSPIHHQFKELKKFDDTYVFDYRRISRFLFQDQFKRDILKNIFRSFFDIRKFVPTLQSAFMGLKRMHKMALEMADIVLVQTELEAKDLKEVYNVDFKWIKAPNGVGEQFINCNNLINPLNISNYIICVGRIEPRKNQLSIIKAIHELRQETGKDLRFVIIGSSSKLNHLEYSIKVFSYVRSRPWIYYIPYVPYEKMPSYYQHAKVCVSASWFESTGLTLLEGLFCGTNVVASSEPTKEYLGDYASYCDPSDISSIKKAIINEFESAPPKVNEDLKKEYTWENAATKTLAVYKQLLQEN